MHESRSLMRIFKLSLPPLVLRNQHLSLLPAAKITGADTFAHPFDNPAPPPSIFECSSGEMSEVSSDSDPSSSSSEEHHDHEELFLHDADNELGSFLLDALSDFDPQAA